MARRKPVTIKVGNASVKYYCGKCRGYPLFTVVSYSPDGEKRKRFRQSFAREADARLEATRIAAAIHKGERDIEKLTGVERATYLAARSALGPDKTPLNLVAEEWVQARQLTGGGSLIAAAKEYDSRHAAAQPVSKTVAEVVKTV